MASPLDDFRAQNPAYSGVGDADLADAIYSKFYAGAMPRADFDARLGLAPNAGAPAAPATPAAQPSFMSRFMEGAASSSPVAAVANLAYQHPELAMEEAKGVPILGSMVPQTEAMSQFEQAHPWGAAGLNVAGGIGAMIPAAAAAPAVFGVKAPASIIGWGKLPQYAARLGIGSATAGGIAGTDQAARDALSSQTGQPPNNPAAVMQALDIPSTGSRTADAALTAAVASPVGTLAGEGAARVLAPQFSRAVNLLRNASPENMPGGIKLTAGQTLGGPLNWAEKQAEKNVPVVGELVAGARGQSVQSFNQAVGARALSHLQEVPGVNDGIRTLPRDIGAGHDLVAEVGDRISREYQDVLPQITAIHFVGPNNFNSELSAILARGQQNLRAPEYQTLQEMVGQIKDRFNTNQGILNGEQAKDIESWLSSRVRNLSGTNADAFQRELGSSIRQVQDAYHNLLEESNWTQAGLQQFHGLRGLPSGPQPLDRLRAANRAWADFVQMRTAASAPGARDGVFSPAQYLSAIRQTAPNKGRMGYGDALNQEFAEAARRVLPNDLRNSGTAHGLNTTALVLGVLGGEHLPASVMLPAIGAAAGASNLGQSVARGLIGGGMQARAPMAEAVRRFAPQAGPAAARAKSLEHQAVVDALFGNQSQ
jgi:hypothetical protein